MGFVLLSYFVFCGIYFFGFCKSYFVLHLLIYCGGGRHYSATVPEWRSEESGPQSSHSAMWVPEIKPRLLGLTTSAFTSEAPHLPSKSYLLTKCDMEPTN